MPIALFDKSFIHGITVEEAAVFDMHFIANITPLFFVEVLGDLEKLDVSEYDRRTALVKSLAANPRFMVLGQYLLPRKSGKAVRTTRTTASGEQRLDCTTGWLKVQWPRWLRRDQLAGQQG